MVMVSKPIDSSSIPKKSLEQLIEGGHGKVISKIKQLKEEIEADRIVHIKEKLDKSAKKLQSHIHEVVSATSMADRSSSKSISTAVHRLGSESAQSILNGFLPVPGSADGEFVIHEAICFKSTKMPKVQRIPTYTTWIFLNRNQRMAEDQSVVGRRRIYYDPSGNEALVCTDSDDDIAEVEEDKHEFSAGEDRILWLVFQEHGLNEDIVAVVSHFIGGTPVEIQDRYNELKLKFESTQEQGSTQRNLLLEKSLSAALDSFDNLFCRRCLVFDCRLHGCSQSLVYPSEKQLSWSGPEDREPCSDQCHLLGIQTSEKLAADSDNNSVRRMKCDILEGEKRSSNVFSSEENVGRDDTSIVSLSSPAQEGSNAGKDHANVGKRKITDDTGKELGGIDGLDDSFDKKQKKLSAMEPCSTGDIASTTAISSAKIGQSDVLGCDKTDSQLRDRDSVMAPTTSVSKDSGSHRISNSQTSDIFGDGVRDTNRRLESKQPTISFGAQREKLSGICTWKPLEKDLYVKGLEIFGRNSCLIARNLLSGLKTCAEVFHYMHNNGSPMPHKLDTVDCSEDSGRADSDNMEKELSMRPRSRICRKRGRTRKLKYSSKSNGHPSSWRRVGDEDQPCKQYTPCSCEFMCGKDCSCLSNGTCCEKYCGCSKSCKNRFRGCHCAKSQCRSRQCPCFAANRECDPDVCRNCWVSCGGGSLGEPPKRGDGQCGNMRLLLRQQQGILLGRSDIAGWGAFIKNSVNKHDYLGEYTGELISHREADKRGKIYDLSNSSFLFDLNNQYVLDACRQGDKLKFANHSSKPNCYCRVMLVAGDHRVGIFAKERIEAHEELFYDYRYGPDQAPV